MHPPSSTHSQIGYEDSTSFGGPLSGGSFKSFSGLSSPFTPSPTQSRRRGRGRKGGNNGDRMGHSSAGGLEPQAGSSDVSESPGIFPNETPIGGIFPMMGAGGRKVRGAGTNSCERAKSKNYFYYYCWYF